MLAWQQSMYNTLPMLLNNKNTYGAGVAMPGKIVFLQANEIIRCKAMNNYTRFYFENGELFTSCHTLRYFEAKFANAGFIRIHRGEMVNKKHITKYNRRGILELTDGSLLTIAKRRRQAVFGQLQA